MLPISHVFTKVRHWAQNLEGGMLTALDKSDREKEREIKSKLA